MKRFNNHWSQSLYAAMNDKELVEYEDEKICVIKDKYPKAQKHFLVLPKEKLATLFDLQGSVGPNPDIPELWQTELKLSEPWVIFHEPNPNF